MESGGQPGNQNATKGKIWSAAINRALAKRSKVDQVQALDILAEKLLTLCDEGDLGALKELGDRLDGKAHQSVDVGNPDGTALFSGIERVILKHDKA